MRHLLQLLYSAKYFMLYWITRRNKLELLKKRRETCQWTHSALRFLAEAENSLTLHVNAIPPEGTVTACEK